MTHSTQPLFEADGLRIAFGPRREQTEVVRGISFAVRPGECLALVGESGSGKSVTARTLLGLTGRAASVTADRLAFDGTDLTRTGERAWKSLRGRRIGLVLQDALVSLDPLRTVGAEIGEVLRVHGVVDRAGVKERVLSLLTRTGVPEPARRARQYPHQLSGGLRQRALIATALAGGPELLVADEPTTALDVTVQAQILDLLGDLVQDGVALLLISHDLAAVARLADRIAVMHAGRIVEQGPAAAVLEKPEHPYTRALLAAVPATHLKGTRLAVTSDDGRPGTEQGCGYAARCALADDRCRTSLPSAVQAGVPLDDAAGAAGHRTLCWYPGAVLPAPAAAVPLRAGTAHREGGKGAVLIEAAGLAKRFPAPDGGGFQAVDDVSLTLRAGETLGVVGESGSGKTTVARIVLGLERPDSGTVLIDGRGWDEGTAADRRERRRRVQTVHQDPLGSFDPRWSVERIITEAVARDGVRGRRERRARTCELLDQVGLPSALLSRRPLDLSGGQRQRVAIARALAPRPDVIVCDEPVSALDVSIQAQILDLLTDLQQRTGVALLFISHDLGVVHHVSDRLIVMKDGRIVESGTVSELFAAPAHPYTRALLAAVPRPEAPAEAETGAGPGGITVTAGHPAELSSARPPTQEDVTT
ncbi:dipeptide ABC transporter ATP-binding protein [Streptomyces sp. NPDC049040]|uniref:dipeptide ABC transporter ATP-binding protein n=1 Tax=Streptomyces sp. NPDC049040 TaxID=3365593 RepID=UPI00371DDB71